MKKILLLTVLIITIFGCSYNSQEKSRGSLKSAVKKASKEDKEERKVSTTFEPEYEENEYTEDKVYHNDNYPKKNKTYEYNYDNEVKCIYYQGFSLLNNSKFESSKFYGIGIGTTEDKMDLNLNLALRNLEKRHNVLDGLSYAKIIEFSLKGEYRLLDGFFSLSTDCGISLNYLFWKYEHAIILEDENDKEIYYDGVWGPSLFGGVNLFLFHSSHHELIFRASPAITFFGEETTRYFENDLFNKIWVQLDFMLSYRYLF